MKRPSITHLPATDDPIFAVQFKSINNITNRVFTPDDRRSDSRRDRSARPIAATMAPQLTNYLLAARWRQSSVNNGSGLVNKRRQISTPAPNPGR